jgi:hypothetical protein
LLRFIELSIYVLVRACEFDKLILPRMPAPLS